MALSRSTRIFVWPVLLGIVGVILLVHWVLVSGARGKIERRLPGVDKSGSIQAPKVNIEGKFEAKAGKAGELKGSWPCFRGANHDNICQDPTPLLKTLPGTGPARVWQVQTGEGYAGAAVVDGRLYLLDYDEEARRDVLRCLSTTDGAEIWRRGYEIDIGRNHGISRTMCAVAQGFVVSFGPKCQVMCADAISGDFKWGMDLVRDYGATVPQWYAGQNPLVDEGRVILGVGGTHLLMAVELASGKILWTTPNPRKWQMTHTSVATVMFKGRKLYVYCGSGGVVGVAAETGQVVFEYLDWKVSMANVPTPVPVSEDRIFLSGGYGAGSMMLKLEDVAGKVVARPLFKLTPEVFGAEQHTPMFYKGYLYGIAAPSGQLVCLDLEGKRVWASGGKNRYGLGPCMIADGMIIVINDTGTLLLVEATPEAFKPLGKAEVFEHGHEAWGPMSIVGGKLFARDMTRLACFDLRRSP